MTQALLTVDLGYGDAGKGSIVDYLTRTTKAGLVVRYNGGCQAAHNVVLDDGTHHTFSQFGSGTLAGAATFLSRFMLIAPDNFISERNHLMEIGLEIGYPFPKVYVDYRAPIVTPFHRMANRIREIQRGKSRHGSCGQGIGETMADVDDGVALRVKDLMLNDLATKLWKIAKNKIFEFYDCEENDFLKNPPMGEILSKYDEFLNCVLIVNNDDWLEKNMSETTIFEGSQGVLLDPRYGTWPHVTYGNTTLEQADVLLKEANFSGNIKRIGVTRAYATRHGPGPLPTEHALSGIVGEHNEFNDWQRKFRFGYFDMDMINFALSNCPVDSLAVTCLDHVKCPWTYFMKDKYYIERTSIIDCISRGTKTPVSITSYGPMSKDKTSI